MKRLNHILPFIAISLFLSSCEKTEVAPEMNYNDKANELILQILSELSEQPHPCDCILEIPKESMLEIIELERPAQFKGMRKILMKKLALKDGFSLDSLAKLSDNFIFDEAILKQQNIKLIDRNMVKSRAKHLELFKMCPDGVLSIEKPIFDKHYKTAVINVGHAFTCSAGCIANYQFKDGKWIEKQP